METPIQLTVSPDQIPKLNGSNYVVWRLHIMSLLKVLDLYDICNGNTPLPSYHAGARALYILSVTISESVLTEVMMDTNFNNDARGIWQKLEKKYTNKPDSKILNPFLTGKS